MFIEMLASEPRMVIHVTVSTIEALVLGCPSIDVKDRLDPLLFDTGHGESASIWMDSSRFASSFLLDSLDLRL